MKVDEYRELLKSYLAGGLSAEDLILQFNDAFLNESSDSLGDEVFKILQDLFEDGEAYSSLWSTDDENDFRITEPTFRSEVQQSLEDLNAYLGKNPD